MAGFFALQVQGLNMDKNLKIHERNTYRERKKGVDRIRGKMDSDLERHINDINKMIESCASKLSTGLKGKKDNIAEVMRDEKEKYSNADSRISASSGKLSEESARCQRKIEELETEISNLDNRISEAKRQDAEYKAQAREYKKAFREYEEAKARGEDVAFTYITDPRLDSYL